MPSICLVYGFVVAFGGFGWICRPWEGGSPDPQSERGPEPGFPVCAPSPSKRHTLIQADPPHPKSGKCPRECGGFMSRPAATLKLAITSPIGVAQSQSERAGRFQSGGRFLRCAANHARAGCCGDHCQSRWDDSEYLRPVEWSDAIGSTAHRVSRFPRSTCSHVSWAFVVPPVARPTGCACDFAQR